ncbi:acyltransferase family protein [Patulibacter defluvii]|uniref:acyltransferase family protein n=1 Tax=Patulibacter defluvii TaxID=3095358 RepID=UPI002A74B412|nr:acyltransferase [Patulibacter sp. DM4]
MREFWSGDSMRAYGSLAVYTWHAFAVGLLLTAAFTPKAYATLDLRDQLGDVPGLVLRAFGGILLLFFVLSAYLIARPFLASVLHGRRWPNSFRYVLRRILRVHPLFLTVLVLSLLIWGWGRHGVTPKHFLAVGSLLVSDDGSTGGGWKHVGHAWSLHVEFIIYLLLPAGLWVLLKAMNAIRAGSVNLRAWVIIAFASLLTVISVYAGRNSNLPQTVPTAFAAFMPGVIIATAEVAGWLPAFAQRMRRWVPAALLGVALVLAIVAMPVGTAVGADSWGPGVAIYGTVLAMSVLMLGILLHELADREPPAFMRWRWVLWFGPMTYPVYVVHVPIMFAIVPWVHDHVTTDPLGTGAVTWFLAVIPTMAISYLLHKFVELPAMAVGARLGSTRKSVQDRFADQAHPTTPPSTAMPGAGDTVVAGSDGPVAVPAGDGGAAAAASGGVLAGADAGAGAAVSGTPASSPPAAGAAPASAAAPTAAAAEAPAVPAAPAPTPAPASASPATSSSATPAASASPAASTPTPTPLPVEPGTQRSPQPEVEAEAAPAQAQAAPVQPTPAQAVPGPATPAQAAPAPAAAAPAPQAEAPSPARVRRPIEPGSRDGGRGR